MPSSSEFDGQCYLSRYPDLRVNWMFRLTSGGWGYSSKGDHPGREQYRISTVPLKHWQEMGQHELRVPGCDLPGTVYSPNFNSAAYLARYWDVRNSSNFGNNPLAHYQQFGMAEGRIPGYEIINELTPTGGVYSPGTTQFVPLAVAETTQQAEQNQHTHPGDNTVIVPDTTTTDTPAPAQQTSGGGVVAWISGNPIEAAAIGAALLLVFYESKHKKRKK